MQNIVQLQKSLENYSDEDLMREAQAPSGRVPQYLTITELKRRKDLRDSYAGEVAARQAPKETVADRYLADATQGLNRQQGIMGLNGKSTSSPVPTDYAGGQVTANRGYADGGLVSQEYASRQGRFPIQTRRPSDFALWWQGVQQQLGEDWDDLSYEVSRASGDVGDAVSGAVGPRLQNAQDYMSATADYMQNNPAISDPNGLSLENVPGNLERIKGGFREGLPQGIAELFGPAYNAAYDVVKPAVGYFGEGVYDVGKWATGTKDVLPENFVYNSEAGEFFPVSPEEKAAREVESFRDEIRGAPIGADTYTGGTPTLSAEAAAARNRAVEAADLRNAAAATAEANKKSVVETATRPAKVGVEQSAAVAAANDHLSEYDKLAKRVEERMAKLDQNQGLASFSQGIPDNKYAKNMALLAAGAAMMGGRSPNAGVNIGEGIAAGLGTYGNIRNQSQTQRAEAAKLGLAADQAALGGLGGLAKDRASMWASEQSRANSQTSILQIANAYMQRGVPFQQAMSRAVNDVQQSSMYATSARQGNYLRAALADDTRYMLAQINKDAQGMLDIENEYREQLDMPLRGAAPASPTGGGAGSRSTVVEEFDISDTAPR